MDLFFNVGVISIYAYVYIYLFRNFANVSLVLVFLSLEKTLTRYEFYYLVVFSLAFFITVEVKEL